VVKKADPVLAESTATTLKGKIIEAGLEVGIIGKSGKNEAQNYKFTSEADVVMKVGPALFRRGVLVTPVHTIQSILPYMSGKENNKQAFLTTIESMWSFATEDEEIVVGTLGQGTDTGGDKGVYKAMTGSKKYALLQALMIATGDDPEVARSDEKDAGEGSEFGTNEQDPEGKPTEKQIRKLFGDAKRAGLAGPQVAAFVKQITGKFSSKQLKVKDMQGLYDTLATMIATGGGTLVDSPHPLPENGEVQGPAVTAEADAKPTSEENHKAAGLDDEEAAK
jgi:hypothetical protein